MKSNSQFVDLAKTSDFLYDSFAFSSGVCDARAILHDVYPSFCDSISKKSPPRLQADLIEACSYAGLRNHELDEIFVGIQQFVHSGESLLVRLPNKQHRLLSMNAQKCADDGRIFSSFIRDYCFDNGVEQIVTYERDMDSLSTMLQSSSDMFPTQRVILTRDDLGGKNSVMYNDLTSILFRAKEKIRGSGTHCEQSFAYTVKEMMKEYVRHNPYTSKQLWLHKLEPFIEPDKNTLFLDVGWKGGMQYWSAAMYELVNPSSKGFVALLYTKDSGDKDSFRGYTATPCDYFSHSGLEDFFLRNNSDEVPRLLVAQNGRRETLTLSPSTAKQFVGGVLRHYYSLH